MKTAEFRTGILFASSTALNWALLAIVLKAALVSVDPMTLSCFRLIVSGLLMFGFLALQDKGQIKKLFPVPKLALLAGIGLAANYVGYLEGILASSASYAQVLIQLAPSLLILGGALLFAELPTPRQIMGFLITVSGFVLFYFDQDRTSELQNSNLIKATLWLIFAAVSWTGFALIQKKLFQKWRAVELNTTIFLVAGVALLPLSHFDQMKSWDSDTWILVWIATLNTVIAYGCFSEALKRIPAHYVSLIICLNPLLTILLMQTLVPNLFPSLTTEPVHLLGWIGAALVVCGVATALMPRRLTQGQFFNRFKREG